MARNKDGFFIEPSAKLGLCMKVIVCLDGGDEGHLDDIIINQDLMAKDKCGLFIALMALCINCLDFIHFEWFSRYRDGARAGSQAGGWVAGSHVGGWEGGWARSLGLGGLTLHHPYT